MLPLAPPTTWPYAPRGLGFPTCKMEGPFQLCYCQIFENDNHGLGRVNTVAKFKISFFPGSVSSFQNSFEDKKYRMA